MVLKFYEDQGLAANFPTSVDYAVDVLLISSLYKFVDPDMSADADGDSFFELLCAVLAVDFGTLPRGCRTVLGPELPAAAREGGGISCANCAFFTCLRCCILSFSSSKAFLSLPCIFGND